jgi:transcriptional regulator of arginine metabolism
MLYMNKENRLSAIRKIITNQKIRSQEELLRKLIDLGFELTQATLSRDLKYLKVGRIPSESGFTYVISDDMVNSHKQNKFSPVAYGFLAIEYSGNIVVIKTLPAYSHTIADAIDKAEMNEVLGTIAGNDTVFAILREGTTPDQFINASCKALPELKEKLEK